MGGDDQEDAMHCAKCVRVSCVPARLFSSSLVEDRQHLVDGAAGFLLNAGGVETR
jgi:hypothetical protein